VVGSVPWLGWNPLKGLKLSWNEDDVWFGRAYFHGSFSDVEFRLVIVKERKDDDGAVYFEPVWDPKYPENQVMVEAPCENMSPLIDAPDVASLSFNEQRNGFAFLEMPQTACNLTREQVEDYAGVQMQFDPIDTNLPMRIWFSSETDDWSMPHIKVSKYYDDEGRPDYKLGEWFFVSLRNNPRVIAGNLGNIREKDLGPVSKYIDLNHNTLSEYWLEYIRELEVLKRIKSLPKERVTLKINERELAAVSQSVVDHYI
jgi:hypothetical protein